MRDPYHVLGIERGSSVEEIRTAYRELARRFHPDRFVDAPDEDRRAAEDRMQEISYAFAVLTNPSERQRFERQRRLRARREGRTRGESSRQANRHARGAEPAEGVRFTAGPSDPGDASPEEKSRGSRRGWRAEPPPIDLYIREYSGWGDAHWVYVHAPGGRAAKMNVTTGEVTIERDELREEALRLLQHFAFESWS